MNSNVEQLVRQIIEELSEGVSDLVLLVVVLAEQNATMPGHLPQTANMVNQTAEQLSKIARQLSSNDYKAYPKIATEINESADAVEEATKVMSQAVSALSKSGDRKRGWDSLVEACRVMSGKTIRLLQIVYGAPMERIRINAENTMGLIDKFNPRPRVDRDNQQNILDQIKPITDGALRQNKYLQERADNAPTDQARRELKQQADDAKQKAQDLVDSINRGFKDPRDADFTKPLQDLKDSIGRGRDVFNKHAPQAPAYPQERFDPSAGGRGPKGGAGNYPMPPRQGGGGGSHRDGDNVPPSKQQLVNAIAKIPPPMSQAMDNPHDRVKNPYDRLIDNLDNIREGMKDNNPRKVAENIKQAVPAAQALATQYHQFPDPIFQDAANDIERLINPFVETGRDAVKNLQDEDVVRPFRENVKKMQRAADRAAPKDHRPPTKQDFDKVKEGMAKAREAAKRRDRPAFQKAMDEIKEPMNRIRFNIKKGAGLPDLPPADGPSDELKKIWEKFRNAVNSKDWDDLDNQLRDLDKLWDRYNNDTSGSRAPHNAAYDLEDAIDRTQGAVDSGNPQRFQPAAQNVRDRIKAFEDEVHRSQDPRTKQAGQRAIQQLRPQIDDYLEKARDAANNPRDLNKANAAANQAARIKQTLADYHQAANPQDSVLNNDKFGEDVKRALADLADAKAGGNPAEIKRALENLKNAMDKYNNHARNVANNQTDPGKRGYLANKAADLDRARQNLDHIPPNYNDQVIERYTDPIPSMIDDFSDTLRNNNARNAAKGAAKAQNLAGYLGGLDDDQFQNSGAYNRAGDVVDLMGGLAYDPRGVADDLDTHNVDAVHETARHVNDLKNMLGGGGGGRPHQSSGGAGGFGSPGGGGVSAPRVPLGQAKSFEDIAQAVAYNISQQSKAFESETGKKIAEELANLASAARSGDKQRLLAAAKAVAALLVTYSKEITDIAKKIPAKNSYEHDTQAHMIKCAGSIRNFATHLKILASVKAASIEQSRDTDQSLSSICSELGEMVTQTLNSMTVTHSVILKPGQH